MEANDGIERHTDGPYDTPGLTLRVTPNGYGFGHDWHLLIAWREHLRLFSLGQDIKVVTRLLNMEVPTLADRLGIDMPIDMGYQPNRDKLAKYLLEAMLSLYQGDGDREAAMAALMEAPEWTFSVDG